MIQSLDQKRAKFREQLLKEFNAEPAKNKGDKSLASLNKQISKRSKFLSNPNNKVTKADNISFMPALKKKPKDQRIPVFAERGIGEKK